jgi:negative regulator of sigma E activity
MDWLRQHWPVAVAAVAVVLLAIEIVRSKQQNTAIQQLQDQYQTQIQAMQGQVALMGQQAALSSGGDSALNTLNDLVNTDLSFMAGIAQELQSIDQQLGILTGSGSNTGSSQSSGQTQNSGNAQIPCTVCYNDGRSAGLAYPPGCNYCPSSVTTSPPANQR